MTRTPDMTTYHAVHTALRAAPHLLTSASQEIDPADRRRTEAFGRYWKGYAAEVLAHHTIEDTVFFPALVSRVPAARELIQRTALDHEDLDELMNCATAAVNQLMQGEQPSDLTEHLRALARHMDEHLDFEDAEVLPLIALHFTEAEYEDLDRQAQKALGIGKQAAFTVPFVAAMQTPEQLDAIFRGAPLAFRILYRLTRRGHARLAATALGTTDFRAAAAATSR